MYIVPGLRPTRGSMSWVPALVIAFFTAHLKPTIPRSRLALLSAPRQIPYTLHPHPVHSPPHLPSSSSLAVTKTTARLSTVIDRLLHIRKAAGCSRRHNDSRLIARETPYTDLALVYRRVIDDRP